MRKKILFVILAVFIVSLMGGTMLVQAAEKPVKLTVVGDAGHNQRPWEWYKKDFLKLYNVDLKIVGVPFAEVYEKEKIEFVTHTGAYDIVTFYPKYLGDFAGNGYLYPLDEFIAKLDPHLEDVTPGYRDFYCKYKGKIYALPYDGDILNLYYRKDLFENSEEKANFKAKYGYELRPPKTWKEYKDVAEFFTREKGETLAGKVLQRDFYGTAFYGQRDWCWAWWGNRFASYGGVYFDEDTMEPMINSPAGVKALEDMIEIKKYCPPNVLAFGYEELKDAFLNGDTAMVIQWPCVGKKGADPAQSKIVGKIGVTTVPGVIKDGKLYRRAMMPCGRVLGIAKESEYPWKAYQVIWHVSYKTSMDDVSTAKTGLDPYRYSHFQHPEEYEMFPTIEAAKIYLEGVKSNMEAGYPELVIPGAEQYEDVLGRKITEALSGSKSAKQALDEVAKEWDKITNRFGREKQKQLYRNLVAGWRKAGLWK